MWNRSKFGNKKTEHAGRSFDSKMEASGFDMIMMRERGGELTFKRQQVRIDILNFMGIRIYYIADFECEDSSGLFYIEIKGMETDIWKIKKKLYKVFGKHRLEIWKSKGKSIYLDETIEPHGIELK